MRIINFQKKLSKIGKILRLLTFNRTFGKPSIGDYEKYRMNDPDSRRFNTYALKAINLALIEAERRKAEALIRSRSICN